MPSPAELGVSCGGFLRVKTRPRQSSDDFPRATEDWLGQSSAHDCGAAAIFRLNAGSALVGYGGRNGQTVPGTESVFDFSKARWPESVENRKAGSGSDLGRRRAREGPVQKIDS